MQSSPEQLTWFELSFMSAEQAVQDMLHAEVQYLWLEVYYTKNPYY